ncbi:TetR/AcrR family transcriptional regulator [Oscillatoria sp. FACHB-1407]|uniref:TetR/AcrR family transcriptional regulator n=1 Tax=Oscillatoria sp. FACHB-1407 TaxID=2692847 RepID=UPI0016897B59|nr:TetR/AcrR family transcriptional regulator [Oscillatoria sp. FACHB-1407]MBD2462887.1 TetR/AcrR family transcriptional regulator [Oscillatoria sp. FACHB-1407]
MLSNSSEKTLIDRDKPEQILKGAMQVFLHHGYAETSMDRIAIEAGVSKHTIYSHFQNKEGLFIALFERLVLRHFQMEFEESTPDSVHDDSCECELPITEPPDITLRRIAQIFLARMDDPEYIAFVRLLFAESGRFPELAQLYMREVVQKGDIVLSHYFKSHPAIHLPDPDIAARIFSGSLIAFILSQEVLHGKEFFAISRDRMIDGLIATLLGGAVTPPCANESLR